MVGDWRALAEQLDSVYGSDYGDALRSICERPRPAPHEYRCIDSWGIDVVGAQWADEQIAATKSKVAALEKLRPQWAQGFSSDSIAAQCSSAAVWQLWKLLGVKNQTEAVLKLAALVKTQAGI